MDVDTVLFDLDGTLCTHTVSPDCQLAELFDRTGVEPFFDLSDVHRTAASIDATSRASFQRQLYTRLTAENEKPSGVADRLIADEPPYDPTNVVFRDGARELLETVAGSHRVGLVTNGDERTQRQKLQQLDIVDLFDTTVFAGGDLPTKPATDPFEMALDGINTPPTETVHIGDSLYADVAGAHASGLESVWTPLAQTPPESPGDYETTHGVQQPTAAVSELAGVQSLLQ